MSTSSFIARPTADGYNGIVVHYDGQPSQKLPLLLAAFQHRFGRDVDAMTRHLIDGVAIGWDQLGTDLLDGAPPAIITALTGGAQWSSRALDNFLITPDGSPPVRMTVTEKTAADQECEWGYVLRPEGIEVVSVRLQAGYGPLVGWDTDPRARFSNSPVHWTFSQPAPAIAPVRAARPSQTAPSAVPRRSATRR
ncbi:hypothetical protein ACFY94_17285 [Streptomyces griseorubiginosus]|uniref:hypothetical protein n=1 Tax=Streptomyces griseorubiginosus TaxID=67304 RepID=UPI0036F08AE4